MQPSRSPAVRRWAVSGRSIPALESACLVHVGCCSRERNREILSLINVLNQASPHASKHPPALSLSHSSLSTTSCTDPRPMAKKGPPYDDDPGCKYIVIENPWPGNKTGKSRDPLFYNQVCAWVRFMLDKAEEPECVFSVNTVRRRPVASPPRRAFADLLRPRRAASAGSATS